ncbi:MAG: hypothetical protein ABI759_19325 [Candidatus Solibacter sp.]
MPQVEIDFEVFKELTNRRPAETVTYNDVIRELLKLPKPAKSGKPAANGSKPWVVSDTAFPAGSEFMADHKGKNYSGISKDGKLELSDGGKFTTPSAAAVHVTGSSVNGWRFWKCKLPGTSQFVLLERLRGKAH